MRGRRRGEEAALGLDHHLLLLIVTVIGVHVLIIIRRLLRARELGLCGRHARRVLIVKAPHLLVFLLTLVLLVLKILLLLLLLLVLLLVLDKMNLLRMWVLVERFECRNVGRSGPRKDMRKCRGW